MYTRHFGTAKQVWHEMPPFVPHIDVFEYYRSGWPPDVCTLVTSGMSDLAMNAPANADVPRRVEIIFYCREPKEQYSGTIRRLAHFPHDLEDLDWSVSHNSQWNPA